MLVEHWREVVEELTEKEKGTDPADVEKAKADRIFGESGLDDAENAIETLRPLLERTRTDLQRLEETQQPRPRPYPPIASHRSRRR